MSDHFRTLCIKGLKWVSPNFCVILYLLFNDFYFGHFQKEKKINTINNPMNLYSKTSIANTFFYFYYIRRIILRTRPPNQKFVARSITLGVGPVPIWQQEYQKNVCHVILRFWLTLGRSLHYFLVLLLLTLNILRLFWMSLNATLRHIFVEHHKGVIFIVIFATTASFLTFIILLQFLTQCR